MEGIAITIDLGGTFLKTGLFTEDGMLTSRHVKVESYEDLKSNLLLIERVILEMLDDYGLSGEKALGIGFSFPGLVDSSKNSIIGTNKKYDDAADIDLENWAKDKFDLPIFVENDARMALLGEWQCGAGEGYNDIVMVTFGTGIGTAALMNGQLLKGKHFQAGNLGGHFSVNHSGRRCTCGNTGCMESEASTWRLPLLISSNPAFSHSTLKEEKTLDFETLFRNAEKKDRLAIEILEHCFSVWAAGITNMIHAFDPEVIILGGGIMNSDSVIIPVLQNHINLNAWTPWGKVRIIKAQNIDTAALFGADYLVRSSVMPG